MKIVALSDVHGQWEGVVVPFCDLLISVGDFVGGSESDVRSFHQWLDRQPAKDIISVLGNHEGWSRKTFEEMKRDVESVAPRIRFIEEGPVVIDGVTIYCSSGTSSCYAWARQGDCSWRRVPLDTEILITHIPPFGILDRTSWGGLSLGSPELRTRLSELKSLKLHVFGHVHSSAGECDVDGVRFINASILDEEGCLSNPVRAFVFKRHKKTAHTLD